MYRIKSIDIDGFWNEIAIETKFKNDINIFIGKNGTGKTTFIQILQAVLTVDLELLYNLQFLKVEIVIQQKTSKKKITVEKTIEDHQYKSLIYKIGTKKYDLPIIPERDLKYFNRRSGRFHPSFYRQVEELQKTLNSLIKVSYLSVNRDKPQRYNDSRKDDSPNIIDARLTELINELISYQLLLETELSKLSKEFQENVLRSMLFNESFDYLNINEPVKIDIRKISKGLNQAYRGLGILNDETEKAIKLHIEAIKKAATTINKYNEDNSKAVYPNDVTPLTLLRRTRRINELSENLENEKKRIFKRLDDFINLLNEFHDHKYFSLQESQQGGISVTKNHDEIDMFQLSSGEKQLIILLTEALLQKGEETLFIADEPELSLHIEWQKKIIASIRTLNPNSQIVVATHSPEIVGKFRDNVINMENIMS